MSEIVPVAPTRARAYLDLLARPITAARMTLLWRLFGLVLVVLWLQHMDADSAFVFVEESAPSLDAFAVIGLILLIAGPSVAVLLGAAAVAMWFLTEVFASVETLDFAADEYVIQAGLPIVVAIVTVAHVAVVVRRRGPGLDPRLRAEVDELHARIWRIFMVTTLAFAGLHKLNADFFAEDSCARLANRLLAWWGLPVEVPIAGPAALVALELLAAIMLLVLPRVGILLVVYAMAGLGHIGPVAFASTCVVMSLAFLDQGDAKLARAFLAKHWGLVAALTLVVIGISFSTFQTELPWLKFGLLEALLVVVTCTVIGTGITRLRRKPGLRRRLTPAALRWWRRPAKIMPGLASWLALILIVNGMSPYLGVKYRFSVAMLSNLRADHERWNSYVIPKWISLRKHTPHALVIWRPSGPWVAHPKRSRHVLADGLFRGDTLQDALHDASARRARGHLTMRYRGESAEFELPNDILAAITWAKQRPSSMLWQEHLGPGDEPQVCVH